jgi:hypothetical protein
VGASFRRVSTPTIARPVLQDQRHDGTFQASRPVHMNLQLW